MLCKLTIELEKKSEVYLSHHNSSLFQGVIMEQISEEYAEKMHLSEIRPYSQYLRFEKDKILWIICTVQEEAYHKLILPLMQENFSEVYLRHNAQHLAIQSKTLEQESMEHLLSRTFFAECPRFAEIQFITPCAFKTQGRYLFYPTIRHIFQSLINKFDAGAHDFTVYTPELLSDLENNISIVSYQLRSTNFQMEGIKVPSFLGRITLKIQGPMQLVNLVHMLLNYGAYCGVGIKSAIGMGAIALVERGENPHGKR